MQEFEASHTHLYSGARGRVRGDRAAVGRVTLVFADGTHVPARLADGVLSVARYRTAAGAAIGRKAWPVEIEGDRFRITGQAMR